MKLKAKNGKQAWVRLDTVYVSRTYAGMLEGLPTREDNDRQLQRLKAQAIKVVGAGPFGEMGEQVYGKKAHPVVLPFERKPVDTSNLSPSTAAHYPNAERLPEHYIFALLDGPATDDGKSCGGMALVIFFADKLDQPLEQMIEAACKDEVWELIAHNYDI